MTARRGGPSNVVPRFRSRGNRLVVASLAVTSVLLALAIGLLSWTGALRLGVGAKYTIGASHVVVPPELVTTVALLVAGMLVAGFMATRAEVTVDEGGVRWQRGRRAGYVPFARIRDASVGRSVFPRGNTLVLETTDGTLRLPLGDEPAAAPFGAILSRLSARRGAPEPAVDLGALDRKGRDLASWLASARAAAHAPASTTAYRTAALDGTALEQLFEDELAGAELRAAAAYVLLAGGDEAVRSRIAQAIGPAAPPIVVVAAALAAPDRIDAALVDEARTYVSAEDRIARVRVATNTDDENEGEDARATASSARRLGA